MKRRISQGQAMRSIFGRSRVTQRLGPALGSNHPVRRTIGSARGDIGVHAAFQDAGLDALLPEQSGGQLADIVAVRAEDDRRGACIVARPFPRPQMVAPDAQSGSALRIAGILARAAHRRSAGTHWRRSAEPARRRISSDGNRSWPCLRIKQSRRCLGHEALGNRETASPRPDIALAHRTYAAPVRAGQDCVSVFPGQPLFALSAWRQLFSPGGR